MINKVLILGIASTCTSTLHTAAFEKKGQSVGAFLQPGHYFEASLGITDADLSGGESGTNLSHYSISDITHIEPVGAKVTTVSMLELLNKK